MTKVNNFQQNRLIEQITKFCIQKNKTRLDEDRSVVFRNSFLQMMPVEDLGKGFSRDLVRPTKEHYSLMIEPDNLEFIMRSFERFENHPKLSDINIFKNMVRVFSESDKKPWLIQLIV